MRTDKTHSLMATFCFICPTDVCTCGPGMPQALAPVWSTNTASTLDDIFAAYSSALDQQLQVHSIQPIPTSTRLTPTRDISQPVESFANDCFPQPHQHGLRTRLLSLLQQSWLFFNQPEPAGAFSFLLIDTDDGKQQCSICAKLYRRGGRALEHVRTHLGHTPFSCVGGFHGCSWPSCGKMFHGKEAMRDHQRRNQIQCDRCYNIILRKNYGRHQRIHNAAHDS